MFGCVETINFKEFMTKKNDDFFIQASLKEVADSIPKSRKKRQKLKQFLVKTYTVSVSFLIMTLPAGAQGNGLPHEMDDAMLKIQLLCLGLAAGVAVIMLMVAGMYRMFGLSTKASSWTVEILKGLGQVLCAPVIVGLIVTIARGLLRLFPGYIPF